jgi:hypothetical protein
MVTLIHKKVDKIQAKNQKKWKKDFSNNFGN